LIWANFAGSGPAGDAGDSDPRPPANVEKARNRGDQALDDRRGFWRVTDMDMDRVPEFHARIWVVPGVRPRVENVWLVHVAVELSCVQAT